VNLIDRLQLSLGRRVEFHLRNQRGDAEHGTRAAAGDVWQIVPDPRGREHRLTTNKLAVAIAPGSNEPSTGHRPNILKGQGTDAAI